MAEKKDQTMGQDSMFTTVGVVGSGAMGCGIAQVAACNGFQVHAVDIDPTLAASLVPRIEKALDKLVHKQSMQESERVDALSRLTATTDLGSLSACDLIIEAVSEDREIKKSLFRSLDGICPGSTIFASNTSTLSITELAASLNRPDRFIGLHFFNPVPVMPLVEVVKTAATRQDVIDACLGFVESLRKKPILVRDQAGFLVNYLLTPYLFDAIRSLSNGLGSVSDIDNGMRYGCGHPMGPLALCDLIGLDILLNAGNILFDEYRDLRFSPPPLLKRIVALGDLGLKTGSGFYDYRDPKSPQSRDLKGL
jgi:3-hydroxybutyryl-CoA dehydrogenase